MVKRESEAMSEFELKEHEIEAGLRRLRAIERALDDAEITRLSHLAEKSNAGAQPWLSSRYR